MPSPRCAIVQNPGKTKKPARAGFLQCIENVTPRSLCASFSILTRGPNATCAHVLADQAAIFHNLDALNIRLELPLGLPV